MEGIFVFIDTLNKRLARPIKDLDDVRGSMAALSEIRESEIRSVHGVELLAVVTQIRKLDRRKIGPLEHCCWRNTFDLYE